MPPPFGRRFAAVWLGVLVTACSFAWDDLDPRVGPGDGGAGQGGGVGGSGTSSSNTRAPQARAGPPAAPAEPRAQAVALLPPAVTASSIPIGWDCGNCEQPPGWFIDDVEVVVAEP